MKPRYLGVLQALLEHPTPENLKFFSVSLYHLLAPTSKSRTAAEALLAGLPAAGGARAIAAVMVWERKIMSLRTRMGNPPDDVTRDFNFLRAVNDWCIHLNRNLHTKK